MIAVGNSTVAHCVVTVRTIVATAYGTGTEDPMLPVWSAHVEVTTTMWHWCKAIGNDDPAISPTVMYKD